MLDVMFRGALIAGGLIVAIGSQNVFVLKQGLLRNNVFHVSAICFVCDAVLMTIGVLGLGLIVSSSEYLMLGLAMAGAAFLYWYGFNSFRRAYLGTSQMDAGVSEEIPLRSLQRTVIATLAITLLNPHVYLDTVVVVGGIAGTLNLDEKVWFLVGAVLVSFLWFFGLGYGARLASPLFRKPRTWRVLDVGTGLIMFWIATGLIHFVATRPT
jgi:L-lysine exporter family protein LysE/ArgO